MNTSFQPQRTAQPASTSRGPLASEIPPCLAGNSFDGQHGKCIAASMRNAMASGCRGLSREKSVSRGNARPVELISNSYKFVSSFDGSTDGRAVAANSARCPGELDTAATIREAGTQARPVESFKAPKRRTNPASCSGAGSRTFSMVLSVVYPGCVGRGHLIVPQQLPTRRGVKTTSGLFCSAHVLQDAPEDMSKHFHFSKTLHREFHSHALERSECETFCSPNETLESVP